jgi:hypothetical protein
MDAFIAEAYKLSPQLYMVCMTKNCTLCSLQGQPEAATQGLKFDLTPIDQRDYIQRRSLFDVPTGGKVCNPIPFEIVFWVSFIVYEVNWISMLSYLCLPAI